MSNELSDKTVQELTKAINNQTAQLAALNSTIQTALASGIIAKVAIEGTVHTKEQR